MNVSNLVQFWVLAGCISKYLVRIDEHTTKGNTMKDLLRFILAISILATLQGCTIDNSIKAGPDSDYTYSPDQVTTFAFANSAPAEFPGSMSGSERVRRLFGYPLVTVTPMGGFLSTHAMTSSKEVVDRYINGEVVSYGPKPPGLDDMLVLGVGIGGAAGAALAATAIASSNTPGSDLRERSSSALCYIDSLKTPGAGDALIQCQELVGNHMRAALSVKVVARTSRIRSFRGSIETGGIEQKEVIYLQSINCWYSTGFAPKDIGGYKAHIFKLELLPQSFIEKEKGHARVEDLVRVLSKDKPANIFYRVSAAHDARTRAGLEPFGVYH
jgi:hypothetical protein